MGDTQLSTMKFLRTGSSNKSLDMHQSRHLRLPIGSCRFPPGVAGAGRNRMPDIHFSRNYGYLGCQEVIVTKQPYFSHQEWQILCLQSEVLLKLRSRSAKYRGHLKQRMKWLLRCQAVVSTDQVFKSEHVSTYWLLFPLICTTSQSPSDS